MKRAEAGASPVVHPNATIAQRLVQPVCTRPIPVQVLGRGSSSNPGAPASRRGSDPRRAEFDTLTRCHYNGRSR